MLDVRGLTKKYRNRAVVDHVTFTVPPGQVTGYLGPNGSGKSTTVKMLAGLLPATSGQILWDGNDIRHDLIGFKRRLGYVPEEAFVYSHLSGLEHLELMGRLRQLPEAQVQRKAVELLRLLWLYEHRYTPISSYSKGMKQRVLIAGALLHDPELLIFDEPLSGLDIASAMLLHELIAELARSGKTILYISHVLEVTEKVCARVIMLYQGKIVANDEVGRLRDLMHLPSLEQIFRQLAKQEDVGASAREIVAVMRGA
jgi:ABC-2 type transport system ATP-binding protein|uniref:ABC transporter related n=1 Tax=Solibacter usitatus (strain Ellin6076) TaxID=234267 RepID=Q01VM7_SOLUE